MVYYNNLRTARIICLTLAAERILGKTDSIRTYPMVEGNFSNGTLSLPLVVLIRLITHLSASCHLSHFLFSTTFGCCKLPERVSRKRDSPGNDLANEKRPPSSTRRDCKCLRSVSGRFPESNESNNEREIRVTVSNRPTISDICRYTYLSRFWYSFETEDHAILIPQQEPTSDPSVRENSRQFATLTYRSLLHFLHPYFHRLIYFLSHTFAK